MKILLNYFFPVVANNPTPAASTAFLKQVCVVVKPAAAVTTGVVTACTTMGAVAVLTDNTEAQQLFNAGMSKVYVLPMDDLDLADAMAEFGSDFFTVLISSDFSDAEITHVDAIAAVKASLKIEDITYTAKTAGTGGNSTTINYDTGASAGAATVGVVGSAITVTISSTTTAATIKTAVEGSGSAAALVDVAVDAGDETDIQAVFGAAQSLAGGVAAVVGTEDGLQLGTFEGVTGVSSTDDDLLAEQAVIENRSAFHTTSGNKAKNMFYAFGKLLSNALDWKNQQYITVPFADDVDQLGDAEALFDSKINFVMNDDEFGKRLGLFAVGGKAIVAPYIIRNLTIDMQSKALQFVSGNQPAYAKVQASLLEDELQNVISGTADTPGYIQKGWLESGKILIKLEQDNFIASGYITVPTPRALWRIFGSLTQT